MQSSKAVGVVSRLAATGVLVLTALTLAHGAKPPVSPPVKPAFEITEDRPRCKDYNPQRRALFGTTHLHTGLSFDASIRFVDYANGNDPRGAYLFAQGKAPISIPEPSGLQPRRRFSCNDPATEPIGGDGPSRTPCIDEPLDWGAVTDHSEHFGVMGFCKNIGGKYLSESMSMECRMLNGFFYEPLRALNPGLGKTLASNAFTQLTIMNLGAISKNTNLPVCNNNPDLCAKAEMEVWNEVQNAAEQAYDRSDDCKFTSFVAYENASTPLLNNWHRNVIFRNDRVVKKPVNALDMAVVVNNDPTKEPIDTLAAVVPDEPRVWPVPPGTKVNHPLPQPFWNKLEEDCTKGKNVTPGKARRCDFITIPHNSNLGGGVVAGGKTIFPPMFLDPYNPADAKRHQQMEPLVEIYQDKGASECRYDPRFLAGTNTIDEFCAFEILDSKSLGSASGVGSGGSSSGPAAPDTWGDRAYVRNVWKDGIKYAADKTYDGINPFKMGVVAASDSHTGVMGWHPETEQWPGHLGIDDAWPMADSSSIENSTGGPSVVWAEENSRDSIFEALKRKETYGTSGPRMKVRFFGGWNYPSDACGKDFVDVGYKGGVPMGGDLPARTSGAPTFITFATWDDHIRTKLQQIQIIKGWVDSKGKTHERVYTVAGDPGSPLNPQSAIDSATCKAKPELGSQHLCAVWKDPDFDPSEHAFYYVRVLEEPVCRYSTLWCRKWIGVDPLDTSKCNSQLTALQNGSLADKAKADHGAKCCSNQTTDTFVQPVIQERAWTSPIWYEPAAGKASLAKK